MGCDLFSLHRCDRDITFSIWNGVSMKWILFRRRNVSFQIRRCFCGNLSIIYVWVVTPNISAYLCRGNQEWLLISNRIVPIILVSCLEKRYSLLDINILLAPSRTSLNPTQLHSAHRRRKQLLITNYILTCRYARAHTCSSRIELQRSNYI